MTTDVNCGQVRGPDSIWLGALPASRQDPGTVGDAVCGDDRGGSRRTRRREPHHGPQVRRALWAVSGPWLREPQPRSWDERHGFSQEDLELLKQALDQMFELDKSAARANMRPVACIAFRHESPVRQCARRQAVRSRPVQAETGRAASPRAMATARRGGRPTSLVLCRLRASTLDEANLPQAITIERWIDWN